MDHSVNIGTQPVLASHAFDLAALERWLTANMSGFAGPLTVEQFKGGQSNPTYKLITPERAYVMRSKPGPLAKLLPSAHAIEREYRVMNALALSGVPVARMHVLCEDEAVIGRAFYVMECVEGRVLWAQDLPGMAPAERGAIYDELNRVLATLHGVDPKAVGLADFGKPGNYFARQIGRWSKQYQASITEPIEAMDRLMAWLPEHMPDSACDESQVSIVHGDYRLDNVIFHPTEPRIVAVLDWELCTLGHPLADFSYHCMSWHITPGTFRGIGGLDLAALGIPGERDYIRRYCERTGRGSGTDAADALLADWSFYLAYNGFRLAAITQGIAKRVLDGTASSAQARATGSATRALAEMAWGFVAPR
ncbi:phosphotransferase family protein [Aquabacterium sp. OR-4]|uniref:phosphotransferase family protein n=1 Tax=Aquabacterium sp. OR-4 TaxID=2978127 RepID=UPI0028C63538|nr:phosphotransferase family protein [Aquabacterium sp. OR-4]MDT7834759.1 phosphotransferase family protein [Aquabacterium sp. OR-4]